MYRILSAALATAVLGSGSALAATCPAFPAPVIKFVPLPSDAERDTRNIGCLNPLGFAHHIASYRSTRPRSPSGCLAVAN